MRTKIQWIGLVAGPLVAFVCFFLLPEQYLGTQQQVVEFGFEGRVTFSILIWMGIWWFTEAIEISATALLPLVLLPVFGAASMESAATPYAHPLIFLFMGGFLIALSMRKWGMDKRVALVTLSLVGTRPKNMVGGFMIVSAVLSAFVSNTATTTMMLPIALSVISLVRRKADDAGGEVPETDDSPLEEQSENKIAQSPEASETTEAASYQPLDGPPRKYGSNFAICIMLGLAYASSIGGIATIIGSAPNALLVGFVNESIALPYRMEVSFLQWMLVAAPLSAVLLPVTWWLLTSVIFPIKITGIKGGAKLIRQELEQLGPPNTGERITFVVFLCTALCWLSRPLLNKTELVLAGNSFHPFAGLTDAGIAMTGAILLFVLPTRIATREFTLDWRTAAQLPWGILILFGGGLSLASAVQANGVAEFIGSHAQHVAGLPQLPLVMIVSTTVLFLTELTSNTATTAALLPVLAAAAEGFNLHPYLLIFPAAIASSCAFMMPVATPPNAIVFGSGEVTIPDMIKAGIWLNLISIVVVTTITLAILPYVFRL